MTFCVRPPPQAPMSTASGCGPGDDGCITMAPRVMPPAAGTSAKLVANPSVVATPGKTAAVTAMTMAAAPARIISAVSFHRVVSGN